jgi:hypothetical protein
MHVKTTINILMCLKPKTICCILFLFILVNGFFNVIVCSSVCNVVMSVALRQWGKRWRGSVRLSAFWPINSAFCEISVKRGCSHWFFKTNHKLTSSFLWLPLCCFLICHALGKHDRKRYPYTVILISQPTLYTAAGIQQIFYCICNMFRHSFMKGFE